MKWLMLLLILLILVLTGCYPYTKYRTYDARLQNSTKQIRTGYMQHSNHDTVLVDGRDTINFQEKFNEFDMNPRGVAVGVYLFTSLNISLRPQRGIGEGLLPVEFTLGANQWGVKWNFFERNNWFFTSDVMLRAYWVAGTIYGYEFEPSLLVGYQFPFSSREQDLGISTGISYHRLGSYRTYGSSMGYYEYSSYTAHGYINEMLIPLALTYRFKKLSIEMGGTYSPLRRVDYWSDESEQLWIDGGLNEYSHYYETRPGNSVQLYTSLSWDFGL